MDFTHFLNRIIWRPYRLIRYCFLKNTKEKNLRGRGEGVVRLISTHIESTHVMYNRIPRDDVYFLLYLFRKYRIILCFDRALTTATFHSGWRLLCLISLFLSVWWFGFRLPKFKGFFWKAESQVIVNGALFFQAICKVIKSWKYSDHLRSTGKLCYVSHLRAYSGLLRI